MTDGAPTPPGGENNDGKARRAEIDAQTVKALMLMRGGAGVTLVSFLAAVLGKAEFRPLWTVAAIGGSLAGLLLAVSHNLLRRYCSMGYAEATAKGWEATDDAIAPCRWSVRCRRWSILMFGLASTAMVVGAFLTI